jgi:Protein of unknown function (DUF2867)
MTAHRVPVTEHTPTPPDYADAVAMDTTSTATTASADGTDRMEGTDRTARTASAAEAGTRSPELWARAVFEGAPLPVRWFLLAGWRAVLGLRLGPRGSPGHVLGWRIVAAETGAVRLELRSRLMVAQLVLRLERSEAVLTTLVFYHRAAARPLWAVVAPIHRLIIPYLLNRAASRPL